MKEIKKYLVLIVLSVFIFSSCKDTFEIHEEYIKGGEIIYTNKVDSLTTLPGNYRVMIEGYITNAFNVKQIEVLWNKGQDSKLFDYSKSQSKTDTLHLLIDGLEEKTYEFEVYSKDSDGNRSVRVLTYGTAYGDIFSSSLVPRNIKTFGFTKDTVFLTFKHSDELTRKTEIKYTDTDNNEVIVEVEPDEKDAKLPHLDDSKSLEYRTFYVPTPKDENGNETSIDQFPSEWLAYDYPVYLRTVLESMTFEPVLGGVKATWDNPDAIELNFVFQNIVGGEAVNHKLNSSDAQGTYIVGGMESGEQTLAVTVENIYKNSWSDEFTVTPTPAVLLDKTDWTVIDFDSEEPAESNWGPPIQGLAAAVIDGDYDTFWHSAWNESQPPYPHYITVDMGAEKSVASFEMFRRKGRWWAAKKHEFWVSSDNVNWTKVANYDDWLRDDNGVVVPLSEAVKARYFKYVATEGYDYYAFLAEINVYGLEE